MRNELENDSSFSQRFFNLEFARYSLPAHDSTPSISVIHGLRKMKLTIELPAGLCAGQRRGAGAFRLHADQRIQAQRRSHCRRQDIDLQEKVFFWRRWKHSVSGQLPTVSSRLISTSFTSRTATSSR